MKDNKSMLILVAADFLMGIYLISIGSHDIAYRNHYGDFAAEWITSWRCKASGFLALLSSLASILVLVVISIERTLVITRPLQVCDILT